MRLLTYGLETTLALLFVFSVVLSPEPSCAQTAAPSTTAALFVVTGIVYRGEEPAEDGLIVVVANATTGMEHTTTTGSTGGPGRYAVAFSDIVRNRAAAVDDDVRV